MSAQDSLPPPSWSPKRSLWPPIATESRARPIVVSGIATSAIVQKRRSYVTGLSTLIRRSITLYDTHGIEEQENMEALTVLCGYRGSCGLAGTTAINGVCSSEAMMRASVFSFILHLTLSRQVLTCKREEAVDMLRQGP